MVVLFTCKNEDPIKMKALEWPQDYLDFSDGHGHIILLSVVRDRNSNSFKNVCMSLMPVRIKKIQSKMKALEWPQNSLIVSLCGVG